MCGFLLSVFARARASVSGVWAGGFKIIRLSFNPTEKAGLSCIGIGAFALWSVYLNIWAWVVYCITFVSASPHTPLANFRYTTMMDVHSVRFFLIFMCICYLFPWFDTEYERLSLFSLWCLIFPLRVGERAAKGSIGSGRGTKLQQFPKKYFSVCSPAGNLVTPGSSISLTAGDLGTVRDWWYLRSGQQGRIFGDLNRTRRKYRSFCTALFLVECIEPEFVDWLHSWEW